MPPAWSAPWKPVDVQVVTVLLTLTMVIMKVIKLGMILHVTNKPQCFIYFRLITMME